MAFNIYTANPVNTASSEIRLIELLPGRDDEPISCIFYRHILGSHNAKYTALSYTWGDCNSPTHEVFVNGIAFHARQNLLLFLVEQRRQKRFDLIWIDAICIDQSNTSERNHQVALMRAIYSQAVCVFVWLGPAAEESDMAVTKIRTFQRNAVEPKVQETKRLAKIKSRVLWSYQEGRAILSLLSRGYWRRVWVVQEILLAPEVIVLCGSKQFHWTSLEALFAEINQIEGTRIHHHSLARQVQGSDGMKLRSQRELWQSLPDEQKSLELCELLEAHHDAECTDIRDRVFGLVGLTTIPSIHSTFVADYDMSVRELFTHTLRYLNTRNMSQNSSHLRKYAILLQQMLKLDHLVNLVEREMSGIRSLYDQAGSDPNEPKEPLSASRIFWDKPSGYSLEEWMSPRIFDFNRDVEVYKLAIQSDADHISDMQPLSDEFYDGDYITTNSYEASMLRGFSRREGYDRSAEFHAQDG